MNLQLSLKKQWFEMTKSGIKTEDYREIIPYWAIRLLQYQRKPLKEYLIGSEVIQVCEDLLNTGGDEDRIEFVFDNWYLSCKDFDVNNMTLGYPKSTDTDRILKLEHKGIEIREGNQEWGAEPGKIYFVIKHGKVI